MKLKYLYILSIPAAAVFLLFAAFSSTIMEEEKPGNEKIIKFSHSLHSELADCQTCHAGALTSTSADTRLMPDHSTCDDCHDLEDQNECNTCHFEDKYEPLMQRKTELIFNHKVHVTDQEVSCNYCHKGISSADYGYQAKQSYPAMADCYSCHNDTDIASNACENCHISTASLRPVSHQRVDFIDAHKFAANDFDADCMMCHDSNNNSCVECHAANDVITEINLPDNFYQPYAPNNFIDGSRVQKLNRVHDLSYRFSHGIDARSKRFECQSCHQVETFCAECHQSEESDFALSGIVPASHLKPGFFTFGAGTGGGEHAVLARRDIESCIACHDMEGADPTCVTCHSDPDGIKGTNAKTHPSGFMRGENGDWHSSQGSVCYNCHVNATPMSQPGSGFCGYCHGAK